MRSLTTIGAALAIMLLSDPAGAGSVGRCGGGGGNITQFLSCPGTQYIVGLFARGDGYVDRVGIRCASFNASGVRGTPGEFQIAGGAGGSSSRGRTCEGNRAISMLFIRSGSYVDKIRSGICSKREAQGGFAASGNALDIEIGGFAGGFCDLECPDGEAMHRIVVRYGSWVDSIEAFCRP